MGMEAAGRRYKSRTSPSCVSENGKVAELQKATETMEHMTAVAPDKGVPQEVLEGAKCVAVIPKLIKGAFVMIQDRSRYATGDTQAT